MLYRLFKPPSASSWNSSSDTYADILSHNGQHILFQLVGIFGYGDWFASSDSSHPEERTIGLKLIHPGDRAGLQAAAIRADDLRSETQFKGPSSEGQDWRA